MKRTGHVYFARFGDFVKIGFSTDYKTRLVSISACLPNDLELVGLHEGTIADERRYHRALAPFHHRLEWFRWCDEVRSVATSGLPALQRNTPTAAESALDDARRESGGDTGLSRALGGISSQAVSQWKQVPAERVLDVERATGVSRHRLRPDLYPPEPEKAAS